MDGAITFQIEGEPDSTLHSGGIFYEPPGATFARFDNVSPTGTATFIAFYLRASDRPLIEMLG